MGRVVVVVLVGATAVLALLVAGRPASLAEALPVPSVRLTDRHGTLLRVHRPEGRSLWLEPAEVPPDVRAALVALEDRRFDHHIGVDPVAVARAAWTNLRAGRVESGASTLTMQVARLLRESAAATADEAPPRRTLGSKLIEAVQALYLDAVYSKDEILTAWLNLAPFGNRTHGLAAAADLYFGKQLPDLAPAELALLLGLPQSPTRYDPFRHLDRALVRQRAVLAAMARAGLLSASEVERLYAMPLALHGSQPTFEAPHFVTRVLGHDGPALRGAVDVRTTLDLGLQHQVEAHLRQHLAALRARQVSQAAALVVDNATGGVLAYAGSADFWDDARGGQNDGVRMLRQPGSALKPFAYGIALASGRYTSATVLPDLRTQIPEAGGAFQPENYDQEEHGPVPLREALASSYNIPAVRLAHELSPDVLLAALRQAGFAMLDRPASHYGVGLVLGNGEVTLEALALAYAGLARGGQRPALRLIDSYRTASQDTVRYPRAEPTPLGLSGQVSYVLTNILQDPDARAPGFGRHGPLELPFPFAVKTGTSKDYRDNWAVGYTPRYTVAVWVGNFDGTPMQWVSGVSGAGPLLHAIAAALGPGGAFPRPDGLVDVTVCPESGQRPGAYCPRRATVPMLPGTEPETPCGVHVVRTVDRRTGHLATASTPTEARVQRVYVNHPPLYHDWMAAHGLALPKATPPEQRAERSASVPVPERREGAATNPAGDVVRPRITVPVDGARFYADPVLQPAYQRLHLAATLPSGVAEATWWLDGHPLDGPFHGAQWPLAAGTHTVEVHARGRTGVLLRSDPITFHVIQPAAPSARRP